MDFFQCCCISFKAIGHFTQNPETLFLFIFITFTNRFQNFGNSIRDAKNSDSFLHTRQQTFALKRVVPFFLGRGEGQILRISKCLFSHVLTKMLIKSENSLGGDPMQVHPSLRNPLFFIIDANYFNPSPQNKLPPVYN